MKEQLSKNRDFYVLRDILLLANVFSNFRNIYPEIYELNPTHFRSAPGLAWQTALKKTKIKLRLLTYIDMLFMIKKC